MLSNAYMLCFLNKLQGIYWLPRGRRCAGQEERTDPVIRMACSDETLKLQEAAEEKRDNRRMKTAEQSYA